MSSSSKTSTSTFNGNIVGLASGMDTDQWITALVKPQQTKVDNKQADITKAEWKQEIYTELNTKLCTFYDDYVGQMRLESTFNKTVPTLSNNDTISVSSNAAIPQGIHNFVVKQMATNAVVNTTNITKTNGAAVTKDTKLEDIIPDAEYHRTITVGADTFDAKPMMRVNGVNIELKKEMTVADLTEKLQEVLGEDAVKFDSDVGAFIIGTSKTGEDQKISVSYNYQIVNPSDENDTRCVIADDSAVERAIGIKATAQLSNYTELAQSMGEMYSTDSIKTLSAINDTIKDTIAKSIYDAIQSGNSKMIDALNSAAATTDAPDSANSYYNVDVAAKLNKESSLEDIKNALFSSDALGYQMSTTDVKNLFNEAEDRAQRAYYGKVAEAVKDATSTKREQVVGKVTRIDIEAIKSAHSDPAEQEALQAKYDHAISVLNNTTSSKEEIESALVEVAELDSSAFNNISIVVSQYNSDEGVAYRQSVKNASHIGNIANSLDNLAAVAHMLGDAAVSDNAMGQVLAEIDPKIISEVIDNAGKDVASGTDYANKVQDAKDKITGTDRIAGIAKVGKDAIVTYNSGIEIKSASNSIKVNGINIDVIGESQKVGGEYVPTRLTAVRDTSKAMDFIKKFVEQYNSLISEMNTKLDAKSAKDYTVLTEAQKDEMSDKEVERWEKKIKDSLLRKDDTLDALTSNMRTILDTIVELDDGEKMGLFSVGVNTGEWKEKGKLHITESELQEALDSNFDNVVKLFNKLGESLYDQLTTYYRSSDLSSSGNFFNDKTLSSQISTDKDTLKQLKTKLETAKKSAQTKITSMEKMISQMNSQSSWLSQTFS